MIQNYRDILLTLTGITFGVISPYIYDRFISPLTIRGKRRNIKGQYEPVAYVLDTKTKRPIAFETLNIKQLGKKIKIKVIDSDVDYPYEFTGEINDNYITGIWQSISNDKFYNGVASFYVTKELDIIGIWIGDTQMIKVGWGFWFISKDKQKLDKMMKNVEINFDEIVKDLTDILS